jgi:hypothetical protein
MGNTRAVRVIMYDLRDHPQRERREAVLRISGSEGELLLQGRCYGDDPRGLGQRIADGLGVEYLYCGPEHVVQVMDSPDYEAAAVEAVPKRTLPESIGHKKPAGVGEGWLF